jgi:osmoprotectant transport system ATP-binding protein
MLSFRKEVQSYAFRRDSVRNFTPEGVTLNLNARMSQTLQNETLVQFRNVSYSVAGNLTPIISNFNLEVHRGETIVLLGESGCGKTTTLRLVNRLLLPTSGACFVEGKATTAWDAIALRRRTGYVIQEAGLFPHFTVAENIALVPRLENWNETQIKNRVDELLELVGLNPQKFSSRYPRELSGGQRQRVGVARALAADPPLLLLDEPFGALDPITRASLQKEFAALVKELKKTAIFVTHDLREAMLLGTRIGLMKEGKMIVLDSPENFSRSNEKYAREYVATLM